MPAINNNGTTINTNTLMQFIKSYFKFSKIFFLSFLLKTLIPNNKLIKKEMKNKDNKDKDIKLLSEIFSISVVNKSGSDMKEKSRLANKSSNIRII